MGAARRGRCSRISAWALAATIAVGSCATAAARADAPVSAGDPPFGAADPPATTSKLPVTPATALHYLNYQRAENGLPGGVTENPVWDAGCAAHIAWMEANPSAPNPHDETPGSTGYTAAGAAAGDGSVLASGADWTASSVPWGAADPWESAPIHLMQLLSPDLMSTGWADDGRDACMVTWGGYDRPPPAVPQLLAYPGAGTVWVAPSEAASESPFTPGQFVNVPAGATTGPYLFVFGYGTGRGSITRATLVGPQGAVAVRTVDDDTVGALGNLGDALPAGGMIIPLSPLMAGAAYTASATFTPDQFDWNDDLVDSPGSPLTLTWTFQVAGGPPTLNGVFHQGGLAASSNVPGIVHVTVTRLPSNTAVASYAIDPNGLYRIFNLPGARYQACFVETNTATPPPPSTCVTASWRSAPSITLGTPTRGGGWLGLPLSASPALAGVGASLTLAAPGGRCAQAPACAAGRKVFYRRTVTLAPHQTIRLPDRGVELLTLATPPASKGDYLFSPRTVTATLRG